MPKDGWAADLGEASPRDLLRLFTSAVDELRRRQIVRTQNNPVADYTEWLVATGLKLELAGNSKSGFDARGSDGTRYQIKGRRIGAKQRSAQMSALRNLQARTFDVLIAVIFEPDFAIRHAVSIPHEVVLEKSTYQAHTNSHIFYVRPSLLEDPRVTDIRRSVEAA